ncbi:hypothetical protein ACOSQ3_024432 [Xanthoceras sorbifolium]
MQGRTFDIKGKGKLGEASKKPRRNVLSFSRGTISIPEDFVHISPSKKAHWGEASPMNPAPNSLHSLWLLSLWLPFMRRRIPRVQGEGTGKLSNENRMLLAAFHNWTEAKTKGAKAVEYKLRAKQAQEIINRLKKELSDRAIDRWLKPKEFMDTVRVEYMRGSTKTKFLIMKVDPNFDFNRLEEVHTEKLAKTIVDQPAKATAEEEAP